VPIDGGGLGQFLQADIDYVIRLDEILWGCVLLAITLVIHGIGMSHMIRTSAGLMAWAKTRRAQLRTSGVFVLTILAIVALHLLEVVVWALFFIWKDAQPNVSSAFYNALVNYTTLGAGYLPIRWRLLEGMLGMAGVLCFAFSTSALVALAQQFIYMPFADKPQAGGS
jgi:hypothetical protein